jgi:hypothetical protein
MPTLVIAVVDQFEPDLVRDAGLRGALLGEPDLIGSERNAEHLAAEMAVEVEREAAPAAADVEHPHAGFQPQLGRDQRLLVDLGALKRVRRVLVIGHGVLPVLVEEQLVELADQVVVVEDVAAGLGPEIDLVGLGQDPVERAFGRVGRVNPAPPAVGHDQQHHVADVVRGFDRQPSVHVGFTRANPGIPGDVQRRALVGQPDPHRLGGRVAIAVLLPVPVGHHQLALADQLRQHLVEQPHAPGTYCVGEPRQARSPACQE